MEYFKILSDNNFNLNELFVDIEDTVNVDMFAGEDKFDFESFIDKSVGTPQFMSKMNDHIFNVKLLVKPDLTFYEVEIFDRLNILHNNITKLLNDGKNIIIRDIDINHHIFKNGCFKSFHFEEDIINHQRCITQIEIELSYTHLTIYN